MIIDRRYRVERLLYRTIASRLYLASALDSGKQLAIKVLENTVLSGQADLPVLNEHLQIARALCHQNIVTIFDTGCDRDQKALYIVTEFAEGQNLHDLIRPDGLNFDRTLRVFEQICLVCSYLNEHDVRHRRFEPEKVIVTNNDAIKISGLGFPRLLPPATEMPCIDIGQYLFTLKPTYIPPEMFFSRPLDNRSDIYSIGCLLYETLTGSPPFRSKRAADTLRLHALTAVPSMPSRIPKALQRIVMKCLEKDPAARFQSPSELRDSLISSIC